MQREVSVYSVYQGVLHVNVLEKNGYENDKSVPYGMLAFFNGYAPFSQCRLG
jgi:hypothetical protein